MNQTSGVNKIAETKSQPGWWVCIANAICPTLRDFREPIAKAAADDEFVSGLMALILDIRAQARADKNWGVADKIRDALNELNVEVEDGKEGVRWSRG